MKKYFLSQSFIFILIFKQFQITKLTTTTKKQSFKIDKISKDLSKIMATINNQQKKQTDNGIIQYHKLKIMQIKKIQKSMTLKQNSHIDIIRSIFKKYPQPIVIDCPSIKLGLGKFIEQYITQKQFIQSLQTIFLNAHFVNLKQLVFYHQGKIDNIEFLTFLDAPELQCLHLQGTTAINFKVLGKTNFKKMSKLVICNNMAAELNLNRMKFDKLPNSIYLQGESQHSVWINDLNQLAKVQRSYFIGIYAYSSERIYQQKVINALFKK